MKLSFTSVIPVPLNTGHTPGSGFTIPVAGELVPYVGVTLGSVIKLAFP